MSENVKIECTPGEMEMEGNEEVTEEEEELIEEEDEVEYAVVTMDQKGFPIILSGSNSVDPLIIDVKNLSLAPVHQTVDATMITVCAQQIIPSVQQTVTGTHPKTVKIIPQVYVRPQSNNLVTPSLTRLQRSATDICRVYLQPTIAGVHPSVSNAPSTVAVRPMARTKVVPIYVRPVSKTLQQTMVGAPQTVPNNPVYVRALAASSGVQRTMVRSVYLGSSTGVVQPTVTGTRSLYAHAQTGGIRLPSAETKAIPSRVHQLITTPRRSVNVVHRTLPKGQPVAKYLPSAATSVQQVSNNGQAVVPILRPNGHVTQRGASIALTSRVFVKTSAIVVKSPTTVQPSEEDVHPTVSSKPIESAAEKIVECPIDVDECDAQTPCTSAQKSANLRSQQPSVNNVKRALTGNYRNALDVQRVMAGFKPLAKKRLNRYRASRRFKRVNRTAAKINALRRLADEIKRASENRPPLKWSGTARGECMRKEIAQSLSIARRPMKLFDNGNWEPTFLDVMKRQRDISRNQPRLVSR